MANPPIQIHYNQALLPLTKVLAGIKRPGDFFVSGQCDIVMPKITTAQGNEPLSFPVPEAQARDWISRAEQAPYGRGELRVRHAGRQTCISLKAEDPSEIAYAAFYADCEHEVEPVVSGYRLCLIYNLIQTGKRGGFVAKSDLEPPGYHDEARHATRLLRAWFNGPGATSKLVYVLEHQYSPAGLCFAGLKNGDAALAQLLTQAAQDAGLALHLAIVHISEEGAAEPYWDDSPGLWEEDEDYEEEEDDDEFEIIESYDFDYSLSDFRNLAGEWVDFGSLPVHEAELLPYQVLDGEQPDHQRVTEATGNEGASYERSYHRACLVLWELSRFDAVLLEAGATAALPYLRQRTDDWLAGGGAKSGSDWGELDRLAVRMLDCWQVGRNLDNDDNPKHRMEFLDSLNRIANKTLLERAIEKVSVTFFDGAEIEELETAAVTLGPARSLRALAPVLAARFAVEPGACVDLLNALSSQVSPPTAAWKTTLRGLAETIVSMVSKVKLPDNRASYYYKPTPKPHPVDADFVAKLVATLETAANMKVVETGIEALLTKPKIYLLDSVLAPAVRLLAMGQAGTSASLRYLWNGTAAALAKLTARAPRVPKDWAQKAQVKCTCDFCQQINRFAKQGDENELRIKVKKSGRQHMHQKIDAANLEMTHITERKGSPYTLVLNKTRRDYEAKLKQYQNDLKAAEQLISDAQPDCDAELIERLKQNLRVAQ